MKQSYWVQQLLVTYYGTGIQIVKDANKRMRLLHAASKYISKISDMKTIYTAFLRRKLDHSSVVWQSGLSKNKTKSLKSRNRSS